MHLILLFYLSTKISLVVKYSTIIPGNLYNLCKIREGTASSEDI